MNPGDFSSSIMKSNIEHSVQNKSSDVVNLQKDAEVYMCQIFVQSHWPDGILLAQNGKKVYGAKMRDPNNECLPLVKKEQLSNVSTVLFQKDIGDDDVINSSSDAISVVKPIKDRRCSIIPLNKKQNAQQKPICTQISKQFPQLKKCSVKIKRLQISKPSMLKKCSVHIKRLKISKPSMLKKCSVHIKRLKISKPSMLKKCSVNIKRLKISKPSIAHMSGIQEQILQMNAVHVKLERVNVVVQCQPKQCDAITPTDRSMVKEKCDFLSQASIPDSAYLAKINALELVIRDLKHELNVRQVEYEKKVAALRTALNVDHVRMNGSNGLSAESQLNQNNESSQMDVELKIPHSLLPRQPQRIIPRSMSTGIRPKESNPDKATFRKQTMKPSMLTLPLRQSYPYVSIKEPEKHFRPEK